MTTVAEAVQKESFGDVSNGLLPTTDVDEVSFDCGDNWLLLILLRAVESFGGDGNH